jgi:hypothetical protein
MVSRKKNNRPEKLARTLARTHYEYSQKSYFLNVLIIIAVIKLEMIASSI